MRKLSINTSGMKRGAKNFFRDPLGMVTTIMGGGCAVIFGIFTAIDYYMQPSEEQIAERALKEKQSEISTEISTASENFIEYELTGPDSVRASGPLLTHEFHFSSGQIYATKGNKELPSIDFDNVNRPEWITETRLAGCEIAQETLDFDQEEDIKPENLDDLKGIAYRYMELNCD